jgi:hypothetical protein
MLHVRVSVPDGDTAVAAFEAQDWGSWSGSGPTPTRTWSTGSTPGFSYPLISPITGRTLGI